MEFLVGFAEVQLKDLDFTHYHTRDRNERAVRQLGPVLQDSCEAHLWDNQFPVWVTPNELHDILSLSGSSLESLSRVLQDMLVISHVRGLRPEYPRLRSRKKLKCLHGRQRYEAASDFLGLE